jgi:hypothetical protein
VVDQTFVSSPLISREESINHVNACNVIDLKKYKNPKERMLISIYEEKAPY